MIWTCSLEKWSEFIFNLKKIASNHEKNAFLFQEKTGGSVIVAVLDLAELFWISFASCVNHSLLDLGVAVDCEEDAACYSANTN